MSAYEDDVGAAAPSTVDDVPEGCRPTPWDSSILGMPSFEIVNPVVPCLDGIANRSGHYTVKMDPLDSSRSLVERGFYYCDTLIEPFCRQERFLPAPHPSTGLVLQPSGDEVLRLCHGAFRHGRFHRDFNVSVQQADERYDNWLRQLLAANKVWGLLWESNLVGFFAMEGARIVLHALAPAVRGKGIGKYLWTAAIEGMFVAGHTEVSSSVSASNVAIMNLYASLGFRFRHPNDVYHRVVRPVVNDKAIIAAA